MDFIISFFRDTIDGFWYVLYILVCLFFIFVLLGIVGDRKRAVITEKLKEKKARDIASGKEAMIAARESKQILDVMSDVPEETNRTSQTNSVPSEDLTKKEEAPSVLVIGADGTSNISNADVADMNSNSKDVGQDMTNPNQSA